MYACPRYTYELCTPPETVSVYSAIGLGWHASLASNTTMPFLRFEAPSRENTPYLPVLGGHHVVHDARVGDHRVDDARMGHISDVERVHAVGDGGHVEAPPRGVHPAFCGAVLDRDMGEHADAARDAPLLDAHHRVRRALT